MAYRCKVCDRAQKPGSKPTLIVVSKRPKVYPMRYGVDKDGKTKVIDKGGSGWEISQEKEVCPSCLKGMKPMVSPIEFPRVALP